MSKMIEIVHSYLDIPKGGYAVELGAADGIYLSTTLALEKAGWSVLCIEANPDYKSQLKNNRKLFIMAACGDHNGTAKLQVYPRGRHEPVSSLNLTPEFKARFCPDITWEPAIEEVPLKTLDACIKSVVFPRVDFLSLDTDGAENKILRGFSLERWKPVIVLVENPFNNQEIRDKFVKDYSHQVVGEYDDLYTRNPC